MPSDALNKLVAEIKQATDTINPQIEGLHDFARLNLKEETQVIVKRVTQDFEKRRDLLNVATAALQALSENGYPTVDQQDVIGAVYDDLKQNVATIEAAFDKFTAIEEAAQAKVTAGVPVLKP